MPTVTIRGLEAAVYDGLKESAAREGRSMEAEARDVLRDGVARRQRWIGATLADLSSPMPPVWNVETPYVRSADAPREAV